MRRRSILSALALAVFAVLLPIGAHASDPADLAQSSAAYLQGCDPLDMRLCLLPFPNNLFTKQDPSTDTGIRLNLLPTATPRNVAGKPIDPTELNRNDGFSPGSLIESFVPHIDLAASGAPSIKNPQTSLSADSAIVVLDEATGDFHPVWAERDDISWSADDNERSTLVRPAVNFKEGHTYIVAMQHLKNDTRGAIDAGTHFKCFRDGGCDDNPFVAARRPVMENIFSKLASAGVDRSGLYLAWDFTVASERNLSERILHIRDDAFASLGDTTMADGIVQGNAPTFKVTQVSNNVDGKVSRAIEGIFTVPNYIVGGSVPGGGFVYGPDGLPVRIPGDFVAQMTCDIPRSVLSDGTSPSATVTAGRPSLYGHGLLGQRTEVSAGNVKDMGQENKFVFCATEWAGMAITDAGNVVHSLADMSNFSTMADRMQQGFVNQMFLGRLMIHPQGLLSDPAFRGPAGEPLIDTTQLFYDGNSQGGIMGGSLVAVSPDIHRGILGVPAMNYSTLLDRSSDWPTYYTGLKAGYQERIDHQLIFSLIQTLWDRGEADGYAHHMTSDPLEYKTGPLAGTPATPPHQVMLMQALGDYQVANIATEVEARTIGASIYRDSSGDAVQPSKIPAGVVPFWGLPTAPTDDTFTGSVYVVWGPNTNQTNPWAPLTNTGPTQGGDPHGRPRGTYLNRVEKNAFLQVNGFFHNACGDTWCVTS